MLKQIAGLKVGLVLLLGILFCCSGAFAMADRGMINNGDNRRDNRGDDRDHRRDNRGDDRDHRRDIRGDDRDNRGDNRGDRHYYRDGRWYRHDSNGQEIAVAVLAIGALVEALPPRHTTIVVQGAPYYYDDSHYYKRLSDGSFVVVEPPRR